jgi:hypothetical protein
LVTSRKKVLRTQPGSHGDSGAAAALPAKKKEEERGLEAGKAVGEAAVAAEEFLAWVRRFEQGRATNVELDPRKPHMAKRREEHENAVRAAVREARLFVQQHAKAFVAQFRAKLTVVIAAQMPQCPPQASGPSQAAQEAVSEATSTVPPPPYARVSA